MNDLCGIKILVIEDTADNQKLIQALLKKYGCEFDFASNGLEGIQKALAGNFDVILMDIQMPIMDGFEAVSELREKNYTKPIVALTAHAMKEDQDRAMNAGFDGYLSKPIVRQELVQSIQKFAPSFGTQQLRIP